MLRKKSSVDVKSILILNGMENKYYPNAFLFHFAKYWADKGEKVIYVAQAPLQYLPKSVGPKYPEYYANFNLMQFLYLPTWEQLLDLCCYSVYIQRNPATVIVVEQLESYFSDVRTDDQDHISLVCASLLHTASVRSAKKSKTTYLICGYNSVDYEVPTTLFKNFFHNIWEMELNTWDGLKKLYVDEDDGDDENKLIFLGTLSDLPKKPTEPGDLLVFAINKEPGKDDYIGFEGAYVRVPEIKIK